MANLFSLFVAINNYPNPAHRLQGCLNDLQEMKNYIDHFCHLHAMPHQARVLTDHEATRQNIIDGFDHLAKAQDGDQCLFFFAGHGSRCPAPEEFWHMEPDRLNETLVCYDSRINSGNGDLIDKELSYLIWKVTKDKNLTLVSITDCCHSGSNMRFESVSERRVQQGTQPKPLDNYLGFEQYKKVGDKQYSPPRGSYIHLSACQAHETAKEVKAKDQLRGIFSYLLVEALKGSRTPLPYSELVNRVRFRIRNYMQDQYPVLEATHHNHKNQGFLSDLEYQHAGHYSVSHDSQKGWVIDAGAFHQISSTDQAKTIFKLQEEGHTIEVSQVYADHSTVLGMDAYDKSKIYPAVLFQAPISKVPVAFAPAMEAEGLQALQTHPSLNSSKFIALAKSSGEARFLIHAKDGSYYLTTAVDERPLFKRVSGYNPVQTGAFLKAVEQVARWVQLQELNHPGSSIPAGALTIDLYKGKNPGDLGNNAPADPVDWRDPGQFHHSGAPGVKGYPTFQLRLQNTAGFPVWVSVLYMGADYSINNVLMPMERLNSGEEAWCSYTQNHLTNRTIPVCLNETLHSWGITQATDYLKILLATTAFDAAQFNQKPLQLEEYKGPTRDMAFDRTPPLEDWAAKTIPLTLYKPMEPKHLSSSSAVELFGNLFQAPQGFSASIQLEKLDIACREQPRFPNLEIVQGNILKPVELGPWENRPQLSVLELRQIRGAEVISPVNPLRVELRQELAKRPTLGVYGLDGQNNCFFRLQSKREGALLCVEQMPLAMPFISTNTVVRIFFFELD